MASITVICPNCKKKSQAPEEFIGKKTKCKNCEEPFRIEAPGGSSKSAKSASPPAKETPPPQPAPPNPPKPNLNDDDDGPNNYGLTETYIGARCPECANEMESEEAIICIHCGYNTRTRQRSKTRKVYDQTPFDYFLWLLPGIACLLALLIVLTFDIIYTLYSESWFASDKDSWLTFLASQPIIIWMWVFSLFIFFYTGKFAIQRLILNYKPPEIEK